MRNTSDSFIARGQVTLKLMDQRDAELEKFDYEAFPAKSGHVFEPSFWNLAPIKIRMQVLMCNCFGICASR